MKTVGKATSAHKSAVVLSGSPFALLIVISAPSGAGKTTLCQNLLNTVPSLVRAITCTTRAPRPGEQDGVDYYFLPPLEFQRRAQAGDFLEHATVHGHCYGTLKSEVLNNLRQGKDVLLNIDVQGAASVRAAARQYPELKKKLFSVFLTPPSLSILEQRLRKRAQDSPTVIVQRLKAARREIKQCRHFDYLLISTRREEDLRRMRAIYLAEKMRQGRVMLPSIETAPLQFR